MLTRLDLSLACFYEKVSNLRNFVMHLATMESEELVEKGGGRRNEEFFYKLIMFLFSEIQNLL